MPLFGILVLIFDGDNHVKQMLALKRSTQFQPGRISRQSFQKLGADHRIFLLHRALDSYHWHVTHENEGSWSGYGTLSARGKKRTQTTLQVDDLPQGVLQTQAPATPESGNVVPNYPTVVLQARNNMRRFENCVLLTRVGGFYELYFEHAEEFGPLLNLKVAQKRTNAGLVPMAGFPFFQLDRFLKIIVQDLNRYVAIAEEYPNDASCKMKSGGLLHDRKVARIITPGTLIDENFIDPFANNYILAIHLEDIPTPTEHDKMRNSVGLAWLDLSTGHFFTQSAELSMLSSIISRIGPREIILDKSLEYSQENGLRAVLAEDHHVISYCTAKDKKPMTEWGHMLESQISLSEAAKFKKEEVDAGGFLLEYVGSRLQGLSLRLQPPVRYQAMEVMGIDRNSVRALEIKETIKDGFSSGSLLHSLRRTVTKSGSRLLSDWLSAPSTSMQIINDRLDLVGMLLKQPELKDRIIALLRRCHDSQRLVQKFALGRGDPEDLLGLCSTILATHELVLSVEEALASEKDIENASKGFALQKLITRIQLDGPIALANKVRDAIDEEGLNQKHEAEDTEAETIIAFAEQIASAEGSPEEIVAMAKGRGRKRPSSLREHYVENSDLWIMKPMASSTLKRLHRELELLEIDKIRLGQDLQRRLKVASLTLRWTPGLGHICHIKGKDVQSLGEVRSVSASKSTRSFHQSEWTQLGQRIDQIKLQIRTEEQRVFQNLRQKVIVNIIKLRRNSAVLDELDVACSFATLAKEETLTRPILNNTTIHKIVGGRHPTVQGGLHQEGRSFVSNDCFVGDEARVWIITGPNMGGKSTFLRQNALITIMAQVGSYVPAEFAEIGIVDQIFSRVGSADDLYRNQSTFMVEMLETAVILRNATSRSFVIMDEIGRGTTPDDGTAIAFACLHHLYHISKCRTLFATHFHALAEMSEQREMKRVAFWCSDIAEDKDGGFSYLHKLRKGVNKQSHALKVARLAGIPETAIDLAQEILDEKAPGMES